jgi:hypothetical protein
MDTFDLDSFEDVSSGEYVVKHPETNQPTAIVVTLAGPEHPNRKKIAFAAQRRLRKVLQQTGKLQLADPEEEEGEEVDMLVACTLGWKGISVGGKALAYSAEAARSLYTDPKRRWLRDQIKAALNEREHFIKRSDPA